MSARFGWSPEGSVIVSCDVSPGTPPILVAADGSGGVLTIGPGRVGGVSAEHAEFAWEFADAARVYARECARWAERGRAGAAIEVRSAGCLFRSGGRPGNAL